MIARPLAPARVREQARRVPTRRSVLIAAGLALGLLLLRPHGAAAGVVETELEAALRDLVATPGGPPGAIAVVRVGNRTQVYSAGLGELISRRRMRPTDHMRIASVAKAFSGAVALSLVEDGVLSLDGLITHREEAVHADAAYRTAFGDPACLKMILDWRQTA